MHAGGRYIAQRRHIDGAYRLIGSVIIAEAFINWFSISSVSLSLLLVVSGAIVFQLVLSLTLSLGIDATLLKLVTALFVLAIVSLPRISFRKKYD